MSALYSILIILPIFVLSHFIEKRNPPRQFKMYDSLDGLRGISAVFVFLSHCSLFYFFDKIGYWSFSLPSLSNSFYNNCGSGAVTIFFIMSSFLFYGKIKSQKTFNYKKLYISRIYRLFPIYILSTLFGFIILILYRKNDTAELHSLLSSILFGGLGNMLGLNNVPLMTNGTAWTLPYEWFLYFSLPILWIIIKIEKPINDVFLSLVSLIIIISYSSYMALNYNLFMIFVSGIVIYEILNIVRGTKIDVFLKSSHASFIVIFLSIVVIYLDMKITGPNGAMTWPSSILIYSAIFFIIASGNSMFGILTSPSVRKIGDVSYSFYLFQFIFMWIGFEVLFHDRHFTQIGHFAISGIIGIFLFLFSTMTFEKVEKRFILAAKKYY